MFCPNKSLELYKEVEARFGEDVAYGVFYHLETNEFRQWYQNGKRDSQLSPVLVDNKFINNEGKTWDLEQFAKNFNKRNTVANSILKLSEGLTKDENGYLINGKRVKQRVTDIAKKLSKSKNKNIDPKTQELFDKQAEMGTLIHSYVENISDVIFKNAKKINLTDENKVIYNKLEKYFEPFFSKMKENGSKVLNEVMIYDKNRDLAGTIDILEIDKDGKISIYDIKTVAFKLLDSKTKQYATLHSLKQDEYDLQIRLYKQMIKNTGLKNKDFKHLRIIPINRISKNNELIDIEVGRVEIKLENNQYVKTERDYLDMIVVADEQTENTQLNKLINEYNKKIKDIKSKIKNAKTREERLALYSQQGEYKKLLNSVIINRDYNAFLLRVDEDLSLLDKNLNDLKSHDLVQWQKELDLYTNIDKYIPIENEELQTRITLVKFKASQLDIKLKEKKEKVLNEKASNFELEGLLDRKDKELSLYQRWFRGLSQINNSLLILFNKIIVDVKDKTDEESKKYAERIKELADNVDAWVSKNGVSGINAYDKLIENTITKDNKQDIQLIDRFSEKFYKDKSTNSLTGVEIDQDLYQTAYNKYVENINKQTFVTNNKATDKAIKNKYIKQWVEKHTNVNTAPKYMLKVYNDKYFSSKWKFINRPENIELLNFYNGYVTIMEEMKKILPFSTIKNIFIPNVEKTLAEQVLKTPWGYFKQIPKNIKETLKVKTNDGTIVSKGDDYDNELRVPIMFLSSIDEQNKSKNLGVSLMLFVQSALNYKYMSEVEDDIKLIQNEINERPQLVTDFTGKIKTELGKPVLEEGNKNAKELLDSLVKYHVYNIQDQTKENFIFGIPVNKAIKTFLRYASTKTLAFNTVSAVVGTTGGFSNAFMQGTKQRFYTNKQMTKSMYLLSKNDKSAYSALEKFDYKMDKQRTERARALSLSILDKYATSNSFFFLQRFGDAAVQNSIALSMLQNHTYKDGQVVKIKKGDKTLLEQVNTGLELEREVKINFEKKIEGVIKSVLGNLSDDDIAGVRTNLFGKALMMFRNWIPRTVDERFGELRENNELGGYEIGRYRYFANGLWKDGVIPAVQELITRLVLFRNPVSTQEKLRQEYEQYKMEFEEQDLELNLTEEEFIEIQMGNIRATIMEIRMILSVFGMYMMLSADDDEEKNGFHKYMIKTTDRLYTELAFYLNPLEAMQIIKSPVAGAGTLADVINFGKFAVLSPFSEDARESLEEKTYKLIPVVSGVTKLQDIIEETHKELE